MGVTQAKAAEAAEAGGPEALEVGAEGANALAVPRDVAALTPMMRQYLELKALHPDAVLFFRLGDFYEMFFEDAVRASELLQITLTARAKGDNKVPMCGVPYHSARRYIARLIEHGLRVAICEQVEEPGSGPGIVRREVTRVITPGMVLDEEVLEPGAPNFLAALHWTASGFGAALLEASTGEFLTTEAASALELAEVLARYEPRELLVPEGCRAAPELAQVLGRLPRAPAVAEQEPAAFEPARAAAYLRAHFAVASLEAFGLEGSALARGAAGAALRYLKETQRTAASHVDRLSRLERADCLLMDEASRANLEVLRTLRDGARKGSLLGVLDRTCTSLGARRVARWLSAPLCALPEVHARLDAVEELSGKSVWREELANLLKEVGDLERLCGRLSLGAGNARDLRALGLGLAQLPRLAAALARCQAPLLRSLCGPLGALPELGELLARAVADEPPVTLKEGGLIRAGFHAELDRLVALSTSGKDLLLQIEQRERERTGISSLKVRYNKVFGYYLEVTRSNLDRVPADYIRKQTTVGAERFVTPELKEYEEQVLTAEERRCALELQLFEELRAQVISAAPRLRSAAEAVATCDALLSFARCAAEYGYSRPEVDDSEVIEIVGGRHPVVERMLGPGEAFVPNDLHLDRTEAQLVVITGPNMAGKSTVMRQVALTALMAQAGCFVPARRARIGLCDRIFTRVGAADNLARGQSTFMVEMTETSHILHHATRRSLVILDEIGRGTSTFDGLSIAWAVAEHLHDRLGARTLFATHYHELVDLAREKPRVKNLCVAVKEQGGKVLFLRKLVPGGANRSYGIEVARLAGLPPEVVGRARDILQNLESGELDEAGHPRLTRRTRPAAPTAQLGLFVAEAPPALSPAAQRALEALKSVAVDQTTPLEALNLLARLQKELNGKA
ncbi:DNA mismatch repair protein MutS [Aggregicoccus sp. 17bor-14]|uniref:DNA mismatch repair protein MutS n=1 Tax=Myxococcaceae TaxID=31 RepID=UPI00129C96DC|nr:MULTISPECIES: DNA mismatch repair protein MutS [Myxococcaceae]MBF5040931.1 DNA mismatch repair protein MutS [Simulacricoccus sp. 17bor-14]MRI86719.1 DNA mismatch repair protein MutS [Aggregicoccus sp. 17bor-14]